jgi:DNA-binding LytR/AlgR family response regulator
MINCVILDDERPSLDLLMHFALKSGELNVLLATTDAVEARAFLKNNVVELLFCDIQMPEISGIDFVKNLKPKYDLQVIFTTAFSEFAVLGFDLEATDYLLKPFTFVRFLAALQKVESKIALPEDTESLETADFIFIKGGVKGKYDKVNIDDIEYIESDGNYISLYHNNKISLSNQSLKDLEKMLPKKKFMRVHKSFIISKQRIAKVNGYSLRLFNHDRDISIGDSYREAFFSFIRNKTI